MHWHSLWQLVKATVGSWSADYAPSMGAAIAYYTVFSLAPLLFIAISVAGLFFGDEAARGEILQQLRWLTGEEGAIAVAGLLQSVNEPEQGIVATVTGVVILLVGATTVFGELQNALDRIWRAPAAKKSSGWWRLIRTRLLSFGMVLGIGFLLLVSLVVSAGLSALGRWWTGLLPAWETVLQLINFVVSFGIVTALFAMIYRFMPRVSVAWSDVWVGAIVTAFLFTIGKSLIGLYLGKSSVASGFGAAGSLIILLVWVYYSAQTFLLGAEFTAVYARSHGSHARDSRDTAAAEAATGPRGHGDLAAN